MKKKVKNYGLVISKIKDPNAYILGSSVVPRGVLRENGDWSDIPDKEMQSRKFETYNCTSFNTLSAVEKLIFVITGEKVNYSDRFLGIMAGTKPPGNDPHVVAEAIRKYGCIPEEMLPWSDDLQNIDEYYSFKGGDREGCIAEGKKWLEKFNFLHEWVFSEKDTVKVKRTKMLEALRLSPPSMAVYAWKREGDKYVDGGNNPNHWTNCVGGVADIKWIANDSYVDIDGDSLKDLSWTFKFAYPKRYFIEVRTITQEQLSILSKIIALISKLIPQVLSTPKVEVKPPVVAPQPPIEPVKSNREKLLDQAKAFLGKDASPSNFVSDEVSCAESVCHILKQVIPFPMITGTWSLLDHLKTDGRFRITTEMKAGNIVISPTGSGYGNIRGHVGIFLDSNKIASNSSDTGKWTQNFTIDSWIARYRTKGGMPVVIIEFNEKEA